MVDGPETVTVDCRWLGYSGIGRFTEQLLVGLAELAPTGRWRLWGPEAANSYAWPGVQVVASRASPLAGFGQRERPRGAAGERYVFPHLVRPLHVGWSLVVAHDTIPVRWAESPWQRRLQRAFYRHSARTAARLVAYSDATEQRLEVDLGVAGSKVRRVPLGVDLSFSDRVLAARLEATATASPALLYIGIDRPHKNLARAIAAFDSSGFAKGGGRLLLVGIQDDRLDALRRTAAMATHAIEVRPRCSQMELEALLTTSVALIQPSMEEGLGLTVIESLAAGVPAACSRGTALEEAARGTAVLFDPLDVADIAAAIDRVTSTPSDPGRIAEDFRSRLGYAGPRELAEGVVAALA